MAWSKILPVVPVMGQKTPVLGRNPAIQEPDGMRAHARTRKGMKGPPGGFWRDFPDGAGPTRV